jgi:type IV pilus assembly protein PilN
MIRINLLPYREKEKKENLLRQIVIMGSVFGVFLIFLATVHFYVGFDIGGKEEAIKGLEARLLILNKRVGDIEVFKKNKKELEQKLGVIGGLEGNRLFPVRMLDDLNRLIPPKEIWLEKLAESGQQLRIEGMARDNAAVAVLMRNLEKEPFVKSVDLIFSRQKEIVGVHLHQFALTCVLKRGL